MFNYPKRPTLAMIAAAFFAAAAPCAAQSTSAPAPSAPVKSRPARAVRPKAPRIVLSEKSSTSPVVGLVPVGLSSATAFLLEASSEPAPRFVWSVDDVVGIALRDNPDLQSAMANYQAARRVVGESVSAYLPTVDAYGFSGRATLPNPAAGTKAFNLLGAPNPYTEGLISFSQTIFDFGKGLEQIQAARSERGSAQQQMIALRNLVILNAQRAFYDVAAAEALVGVAKASLAQYQTTYHDTRILVETGVRPPFDLSQAEVELAKAELALINARNTRDLAKIALLNIMGMQRQVPYAVKPAIGATWPVQSQQLNMDRLTDVALEARPEMRQSRFDVSAARHRLRGQIPEYLPHFDAQGFYGRFLPDYPDLYRNGWSLGVTANWNIFGGLETTFRLKELESRLDQQLALFKKESEAVVAEVAASYMNLLRAEQNEAVAHAALKYANDNFRYARMRYDANVGTILELLIAESSLTDAQAVEVQAKFRHATALAALQRAVNAPLTEGAK